jgi:hypothetical protein
MAEDQVVKGGVCWFNVAMNRTYLGTEVYIKTVPEVEAFIKSFGNGEYDNIDAYGRSWLPVGNSVLNVYRLNKDITGIFTINRVSEDFGDSPKDGRTNLSFLRLVGIGSPEGVRFIIVGPASKKYLRLLASEMTEAVKKLITDYVVPVHINLRISSLE